MKRFHVQEASRISTAKCHPVFASHRVVLGPPHNHQSSNFDYANRMLEDQR